MKLATEWINKNGANQQNNQRSSKLPYFVLAFLIISVTPFTSIVIAAAELESYSFVKAVGFSGSSPGNFILPNAATVDRSTGDFYVVDTGNHRIEKFSSDGRFIMQWPTEPVPQGTAFYNNPLGIAIDEKARVVYVTNAIIQKYDADDGTFLGQFGDSGLGIGQLYGPADIAVDSKGFVYVIDASNNRVNKFSSDGSFITGWGSWCNLNGGNPFASPGTDTSCVDPDGSDDPLKAGDGQFNYPNGIAIDLSSGYIYVADSGNNRIQKFSADGTFVASWPSVGSDPAQQLNFPASVDVDSAGNVYVADNGNYRIAKFSSNGSLLASWGSFGSGPSQFKQQATATVNPDSEIVYAVDMLNDRVQVFAPSIASSPAGASGTPASNEGISNSAASGVTNSTSDGTESGGAPMVNDISTDNTGSSTPAASEAPIWGNQNPPEGKAWVNVWTMDSAGKRIDGYYSGVTRQRDGFTITSFSPTSFELDAGAQYTLWLADYGNYVFDHWQDTGSNDRQRTLLMGDRGTFVVGAVYRNINDVSAVDTNGSSGSSTSSAPASTQATTGSTNTASSVIVKSVNSNTGSPISGYYAVLYHNGAVVNTGFTPATFSTVAGQTYTIEVQDYGSYFFNHWSDNGGANRDKTFTATSAEQTFTAEYSTTQQTSNGSTGGIAGDGSGTSTTASTKITVATTDSAGNTIAGYYTTLWQNGAQIKSVFSPASFTVTSGQTYQVAVSDYGSYFFDHWSDGSRDRFHNAVGGDSLTAVYRS